MYQMFLGYQRIVVSGTSGMFHCVLKCKFEISVFMVEMKEEENLQCRNFVIRVNNLVWIRK